MKAPFIFNDSTFVDQCGDLQFYKSIDDIYKNIELQDIEDASITVYDSEGWVLKPKNIHYPFYELYRTEKKTEQLKSVLLDYLINRKKISPNNMEFKQVHDLVALASK